MLIDLVVFFFSIGSTIDFKNKLIPINPILGIGFSIGPSLVLII